jgi:hypothetical protein
MLHKFRYAILCCLVSSQLYALNTNVDVNVTLEQALAVSNINHMNFGTLSYNSNSQGGSITLSALGVIDMKQSGYTQVSSGNHASFTLTSIPNSSIQITCSATAVLTNGNNATINLNNINYQFGGNNYSCSNQVTNITSNTSGSNQVKVGGEMVLPNYSQATQNTYSTSSAGGSDISFLIAYP